MKTFDNLQEAEDAIILLGEAVQALLDGILSHSTNMDRKIDTAKLALENIGMTYEE